MSTWLLLDCDYLAHRAYYATGELRYESVATGILFGILRDIITFQDLFQTNLIAFCFDDGPPLRKIKYPGYKSNRQQIDGSDEYNKKVERSRQIKLLREEYLLDLGFGNIFYQYGYEADDVIASCCLNLPKTDDAVIISSDHDLFQLLSPRVVLYNPTQKQATTEAWLSREYGVTPTQWVDVKSIAGCQTDCISGVVGVGEKTAAKYISGKLKPSVKAYEAIVKGNSIWKQNQYIVRLPYPGVNDFKLVPGADRVTKRRWQALLKEFGMRSLIDELPRCICD